MNNYELDKLCADMAKDVFDEIMLNHASEGDTPDDMRDDMAEMLFQSVDGSEHVIYYHKAHAICQNCDVSEGEQRLADMGGIENPTYDSFAVAIAFGEMESRAMAALETLIEETE